MSTSTYVFDRQSLRTDLSLIRPGDTVKVHQKIKEGDKERVSMFEGIVIARKHGTGISATFTVRKVVDGIGVEKTYPLHSPTIQKVEVLRSAKVRRAKLYYIRDKAAREIRRKMKTITREIKGSEEHARAKRKAEETAKEEMVS